MAGMAVFCAPIDRVRLLQQRKAYQTGKAPASKAAFQAEIRELEKELQPKKFTELLSVVDLNGKPTGYAAPRWFVHLMGLPHQVVRVVLQTLDNELLIQIRSGSKPMSEGTLDLSAGGHVTAGMGLMKAARVEMAEEIGLTSVDLLGGRLVQIGQPRKIRIEKPEGDTVNVEFTTLFAGMLNRNFIRNIQLKDGEVKAISFPRISKADRLVNAPRSSSSIKKTLPYFLKNWDSFMRYYFRD